MTLLNRFEILEALSRRNLVQTYKCRDSEFGTVVLKVFEAASEQQKTLLQRLSQSLLHVAHKGLQPHLGYFEDSKHVALVFGWIEGLTLAQQITSGIRYQDEELFQCAEELLEALNVLHSLSPPLVHRDIKPENVVRTHDGWVLIDFGASREAWLGDGEVSVIGTTGYAAPEQFFGQALPASDQYGLAATLLHLATHRHPTEFPLQKLNLNFDEAHLHRPFHKLLERMLSPIPTERFPDIQTALVAVKNGAGMQPWEHALEPLVGVQTIIETKTHDSDLEIKIGSRTRYLTLISCAVMPFAVALGSALTLMSSNVSTDFNLTISAGAFLSVSMLTFSTARREWLFSKSWVLTLTPTSWRLFQGAKLVSEGVQRPEVIRAGSPNTGNPLKLKNRDQFSSAFGHSLNPKETDTIQDLVVSYYRQHQSNSSEFLAAKNDRTLLVQTPEFLQRKREQITPLRALSCRMVSYRELPSTPKQDAYFGILPEHARKMIQDAEFQRIGYLKESILGLMGPQMEVFLSADGAVMLHVKPGAFGESNSDFTYNFQSLMDNGIYRFTWSHKNPKTPTQNLVSSEGSLGGFQKDLEAHRNWISRQFEEWSSVPVTVLNMSEKIAISKYYSRHIQSTSMSLTLLMSAFFILSVPVMFLITVISSYFS